MSLDENLRIIKMLDRINAANSSALENAAAHLVDATPAILLGDVTVKLSFPSQDPWLVSCYTNSERVVVL